MSACTCTATVDIACPTHGGTRICIAVHRLAPETIAAALDELVEIDVEIYRAGDVTRPPFELQWIPDTMAQTSVLRDAILLDERGFGSCGELAAAYAAWLIVHERRSAKLDLLSNGPDAWHVVARVGSKLYDPQDLGRRQAWHSHADRKSG